MLNQITIMGRLTRDPELRRTGSGLAVASFTLAVDRDFAPKDGGDRECDFIDCIAWRQTGEFVSKYFTKGRMAVVAGRLQSATGRTRTEISAAALRWWPTASTSETASARPMPLHTTLHPSRLRRISRCWTSRMPSSPSMSAEEGQYGI